MKLFEHEAKRFFREGDIPIPRGEVVDTPQEAADAVAELGGAGVLKAQVLVGGRGQAIPPLGCARGMRIPAPYHRGLP